MAITSLTTIAITLTLSLLLTPINAHSNVGNPLAYNPTACKASEPWCKGSCPPVWKTGKAIARNSVEKPAATWERGQKIEIIWHKNNHVGGFYRRSLVPVKYMFDEAWHKKTAFDFGCWSQGTFQCGKSDVCGDDAKGRAYKNEMVVPSVFPDGDYVFAQVWFGGLHWMGTYSKYSDYFACSFIRIKGGTPVTSEYESTFTGKDKTCNTGKTFPLDCGGDGCIEKDGKPRPAFEAVPREFENGGKPSVLASTFGVEVMKDTNVSVDNPVNAVEAMKENAEDATNDAKAAKESGYSETGVMAGESASTNTTAEASPIATPTAETSPTATPTTESSPTATPTPESEFGGSSVSGVKITKAKSSDYKGPVKNVRVIVDAKIVAELEDGDEAVIDTNGKDITFEAFAGKSVGNVYFKIEGERQYRESTAPYVYQGHVGTELSGYSSWRSPIFDKKFPLFVITWYKSVRTELKVYLTLSK